MCQFKGEYYLTGIASFCKFKTLFGLCTQSRQESSHFISVASHRLWIEDIVPEIKASFSSYGYKTTVNFQM